jgi:nitroreductase
MEALEAIQKRRSIRKFTGDIVPRTDLEKIVDAGRLAASGSNRQPWDFIVVTDREIIAQLTVVGSWMRTAGAIIAVVLDPYSHWWREDGSAAIQNMLVASTALGYGSCWVEGDALPREEEFKTLLFIPKGKRLLALVPIGVPEEYPVVEKRPLESVLHWQVY